MTVAMATSGLEAQSKDGTTKAQRSDHFSSTTYNTDRTEPGSKLRCMDASQLTGQMNRKKNGMFFPKNGT